MTLTILGCILRILCPPCAAVVIVLDGGLDAFDTADAKNALVRVINTFKLIDYRRLFAALFE